MFRRYTPRLSAFLARAAAHGPRAAVVHKGRTLTYTDVLAAAGVVAKRLRDGGVTSALLLTEPGAEYVVGTYGAWGAEAATVPLCASHTVKEMVYYAEDSQAGVLLYDAANTARAEELAGLVPGLTMVCVDADAVDDDDAASALRIDPGNTDAHAVLVYTSGTTGNPKGAVHTHGSLQNQVECLVAAWGWHPRDHIFNCLPLHHVHGLVNVLLCALYTGATCEFISANPKVLHAALADPSSRANLFMAVPTIYARLLAHHVALPEAEQTAWRDVVAARYRLMVSGSASLPPPVLEKWRAISGQSLLERYGMTETGMILSQPLQGERQTGTVGTPLPTVNVRIDPMPPAPDAKYVEYGELLVKSESLFKQYYRKGKATEEAFTEDGWFRTGDSVGRTEDGVYTIVGRTSVDIIKSAGYKLGAGEIEAVFLDSPLVGEAAVLGLADETFGEVVAAVVSPAAGVPAGDLTDEKLSAIAAASLAKYKVPRRYRVMDAIPRNAMGKVNKKQLRVFFDDATAAPA